MEKDPVVSRYAVFDLEQQAEPRVFGDGIRLEKYVFQAHRSGAYSLLVQLRWNAGAQDETAANTLPLPRSWSTFGWDSFLAALETQYPADRYGYSAEELRSMDGLKEFLGFDRFLMFEPDPYPVLLDDGKEEPEVPVLRVETEPPAWMREEEEKAPKSLMPEAPKAPTLTAEQAPAGDGFLHEKNRICRKDLSGKTVAEVSFFETSRGVFTIYRTVVDKSLRGQGIASELVEAAVKEIEGRGGIVKATCPYAVKWLEERKEKHE